MCTALVYQDYLNNNMLLFAALAEAGFAVAWVDADGIAGGALTAAVDLLVMPGGEDLFYCERLNGAGNAAIRRYVAAGGTYLGICAGAYYACRQLAWEAGRPGAITGARQLAFYPGTATGPIYEFLEDGDIGKTWDWPARVQFDDGVQQFEGLGVYSGGPVFSPPAAGEAGVRVLARFTELPGQPAAVVKCAVGQGRAILTSLHSEWDAARYAKRLYAHKANTLTRKQAVLAALQKAAAAQAQLWQAVLTACQN